MCDAVPCAHATSNATATVAGDLDRGWRGDELPDPALLGRREPYASIVTQDMTNIT